MKNKFFDANKLIVLICIIIFTSGCLTAYGKIITSKGVIDATEFKVTESVKDNSNIIFKDGCVEDKKAEEEIATTVLTSVYGDDFDNGMPLLIKLNQKKKLWMIRTQLPDGHIGGLKYITIKKSNAQIVNIWATK